MVLDVGCGTGANFGLLSQYGAVVSQDSYEAPLTFCRRRGIGRLVRANAGESPFGNGVFGLVAATDVLEHLSGHEQAVQEAARESAQAASS